MVPLYVASVQFPANHIRNQLVFGHVFRFLRRDIAAIPHNRNPVRNLIQLVQSVGDINNGNALLLQLPDNAE